MILLIENKYRPDAREHFESKLFEMTGFAIRDFQVLGERIEFGYALSEYRLERFPDDPYWRLSIEP